MGWQTLWVILKLMLMPLALATAVEDDFRLFIQASNNGKWFVGGSGQVSCFSEGQDAKYLSLRLNGYTLATETVENTVRYTNRNATESVQSEYVCLWKGYAMTSVRVTVFAVLNVTDLTCRFEVKDKLNCSFSRADGKEFYEETRYELSVASGGTGHCTSELGNPARMHCILETAGYAHDLEAQTFNLTMITDQDGGTQTQMINLPFESIYVPRWPSSEPNATSVNGNQTCLVWENAQELLKWDLEWLVELRPRLPEIPSLNLTLPGGEKTDQRILTLCFPHPPQGMQVFGVRLKCRIKGHNTIWSDYFPEFEITTSPTVPARPPQFVPNGYFFDKDKDELVVFWFPLDTIDYNGPNLTYDVYTNGQEATSHAYSSFGILPNWDRSQPANVTVRSRNSIGASVDSSWLWVPAINAAEDRWAALIWDITKQMAGKSLSSGQ